MPTGIEPVGTMGLFLSTYVNKVDKKGRVSVPAPFRSALLGEGGQAELVVFRSLQAQALDACPIAYLDQLSAALDDPATPDDYRDLIETTVFGGSVRLTIDPEGRIIIPNEFLTFAGISESVSFVGRRKTFQIWEPAAFAGHERSSREQARANNISLSTILAKTSGLAKGGA
ncbi:division/cell wall cluster transcriptional repressor MraZ [Oleisolibacter albus]|uniref:division/cell wall cluster transcriptional repressor MraZ n=1 Tax=Oleisolibacter albus TaxID=2171757 RepID=UPI001EFD510B|nr:MraZ family transcriptional regulator [Oleisolibacter albus]